MNTRMENRPVFTTLTVTLDAGESFRAEGGAMVSMSTTVELQSKATSKGFGGLLKSAVGGEGLFASEFTASGGPGEVVLAPPTPGDIIEFNLAGQTLFAQSGAYLAGTNGLELGTKGSLKSMLSGEGIFLQTISGTGTVWLSCYGSVYERTLAPGEAYTVDTGHMLAFEETMSYTVKKAAKGLFSTFASGEGLVARFEGPGTLYIQSRNLSGFAALLSKLLPSDNK
jgi:uncharacterized protein (TIGR00266 family)